MLKILYQRADILVAQSLADFDKTVDNPYGRLNLGLHTGDEPMLVLNNRAKLLAQLNQHTNQQIHTIYWLNQIHSEKVATPIAPTLVPQSADAWTTVHKNEGLAIMTADCVPIVLFGRQGAVACIHAGWQGLVKGVIGQTARQLPADDYEAVIGACIGANNYEVDIQLGQKIVDECIAKQLVDVTADELKSAILLPHHHHQKCYLDIQRLTKLQLTTLNIKSINQEIDCSYDGVNAGEYYSHRYATHHNWTNTGRMAMVVARLG